MILCVLEETIKQKFTKRELAGLFRGVDLLELGLSNLAFWRNADGDQR